MLSFNPDYPWLPRLVDPGVKMVTYHSELGENTANKARHTRIHDTHSCHSVHERFAYIITLISRTESDNNRLKQL